jgi:hypothetical protein
VGPRADLEVIEKRKIYPLPGFLARPSNAHNTKAKKVLI